MPVRRLQTTQDLRRYLAGLINRTEAGKIDANLAREFNLYDFYFDESNRKQRSGKAD